MPEGTRGPGKPKGNRPTGWSKEFVLTWLRDHPEGKITRWLDWLAKSCACHAMVLNADIRKWKKLDLDFRRQYRALMAPRDHGNNAGQPSIDETADPDWRETFCTTFLETGSKEKAARAIGKAYSTVAAYLNPKSPDYDEGLHKMWLAAWQLFLARDEDRIETAARLAEELEDPRTLAWIAFTRLERLDRETWGRHDQLEVRGRVDVVHSFEESHGKALRAAESISQQLFRQVPEQAALPPAREVVEAELVER